MSTSFPDDRNGSRVLITTRNKKVAEFASSSDMWIFRTRSLNPEESWKLLSKTATSNGKLCSPPPEFEIIGRCIVEKCMGIPLVIVLIGGLLATLNNSPSQWQDILFTISSCKDRFEILLYNTIEVCYHYLPTHLKACFLYFGVFPKNTEIHVKKLIKLWVAEGFVNPEMNKSLEEISKDYLCDLINRRLVQIHKRSSDRKIKSCMLHDILHKFCLRKAIEEEDIMMVSTTEYDKFLEGRRWVSRQYGCWSIATSYFTNSSLKIRSLFYFDDNLYLAKCWSFSSLKLLRVLDLSLIKYWHGMPSEIVNLVHLRYLALTTIGYVCNSQLFKLQSLQTLILSAWTKEFQLQLPCDVLDLPWLRHVRFDKGSSSYLPNLVQENLQTLSWFKVTGQDSRTTNFTKVPNLKELGIYIEEWTPRDGEFLQLRFFLIERSDLEHWNANANHFPALEHLILRYCWDLEKLPNDLRRFVHCD
ncbi:PREDICTED: putative late blight resistance protein homolog R1A-10 isoform X2 [Ipomoea nil]|uniref:putative late blight resistance protein homolog R1A-10 isoform X2 n=1 Tax=Ipomoea nil TaxID=35883 RepID=UPI000901F97B|nr:PREDICTED: putative late blight resistance protein homolog R1A-10 isoform X2 [Ipomoea nil]